MLREVIQSATLLSLLQFVFSERSAHNFYSYFYQHSPTNLGLGAAFTLLKNPINKRICKGKSEIGAALKCGNIAFKSTTQRNLFFLNFNDVGKSKKEIDVLDSEVVVGKLEEGVPIPKYQKESPEKVNRSNLRSSFDLSSIVNVEALLLASGQASSHVQSDATSEILLKDMMTEVHENGNTLTTANYINDAEDQMTWDALKLSVQENLDDLTDSPLAFSPSFEFSLAAEVALKEATNTLEVFINNASSSLSPERVQQLIVSASRSLQIDQNADVFKTVIDQVVAAAEMLARDQGLDVSEAAAQARATTKYTAELLHIANGVLTSGYVKGDIVDNVDTQLANQLNIPTTMGKPLFHDYKSVETIADHKYQSAITKAAEMSLLAGAIYEDTIPRTHNLGHSIVANGVAANVAYMVTDKIDYESYYSDDVTKKSATPLLVRTITIRGFDAGDESVDRVKLLDQICNAASIPLGRSNVNVHKGLYEVALEVYQAIRQHIDMVGPNHKIVLNGHSIGGSISILVMFILIQEKGAAFVNNKILRAFTFGSPPIANVANEPSKYDDLKTCSILKSLSIDTDKVYGYVQPWDPIVRLFSRIDPLYPLIGDIGSDGNTLYASGPARTLRPILRGILESWDHWPSFRDNYRSVMDQEYDSIGVQHLLMPDTGRYLTDRLISVNINSFPIDEVVSVSSNELYFCLEEAFPLDTFTISLVPTAIRSFIHHFYPAYTDFAEYADKKKKG